MCMYTCIYICTHLDVCLSFSIAHGLASLVNSVSRQKHVSGQGQRCAVPALRHSPSPQQHHHPGSKEVSTSDPSYFAFSVVGYLMNLMQGQRPKDCMCSGTKVCTCGTIYLKFTALHPPMQGLQTTKL